MKKLLLLLLTLSLLATVPAPAQIPSKGGKVEATGAAAMSVSYTAVRNAYLTGVRVHLSAAATQDTLLVYIDSAKGSTYDVVLLSQAMAGLADVVWIPDGRVLLENDDKVMVTFTNTDTRTYGTEITYEY